MALTDEEKRQLAQLEASLLAEDPQLAQRFRGAGQRRLPVRRLALGIVGLAVGLTLLVVGLQTYTLVSVLGFLVMLAAAVTAVGAGRTTTPAARPARTRRTQGAPKPHRASNGDAEFMDRMEDRWRRRQEGGR